MSAKIYVPAIDGWDFFEDNIGELKGKSVEIASGDDTFIYMTEHAGLPLLTVECLGVDVEIVPITSSAELYYHLGRLYRDYILLPDENIAESTPDESAEEDAEALSRDELAIRRLCRSYTSSPDENIVELEPDEPTDWDDERLSDDELAILRDDELMCATQDFLTVLLSKEDYEDLFACFEFDTCREVLMSICNMFWETYAIDIDWPLTERDMEGITDD